MEFSRRQVLQGGAAALAGGAAAFWLSGKSAQHAPRAGMKNDRLTMGMIGVGKRGSALAEGVAGLGDLAAICDVNRDRAEIAAAMITSNRAEVYQDYRRLLDRRDIEGVVIATPDHWHAPLTLAALKAGKHVYCEKPLTLTVNEGQPLIRAVAETGRVLQVGTQQRSERHFRLACELVRNGRLGTLRQITVALPRLTPIGGPFAAEPAPRELNWDAWQGRAPARDYSPYRYHFYNYWYEYGGGIVTGWGSHHLDIVHWALDVERSGPISVESAMPTAERRRIDAAASCDCFNTPADFKVDFLYPGDVRVQVILGDEGILFEGDRGRIYVNRGRLTGKPVEELDQDPLPADAIRLYESSDHLANFVNCTKTGRPPISDVVSQHRSATACHLANISLRLGRKLSWDSARETFVGDEEANQLLGRSSRAPYDFGV